MEMARPIAGGKVIADGGVEGEQAGGVALFGEEISEAGGHGDAVIGFGFIAERFGVEAHRAAEVDEEIAAKVGFVFELLR